MSSSVVVQVSMQSLVRAMPWEGCFDGEGLIHFEAERLDAPADAMDFDNSKWRVMITRDENGPGLPMEILSGGEITWMQMYPRCPPLDEIAELMLEFDE